MLYVMFEHGVTCVGRGVRTTCGQRLTDGIKTSVWKHKLGVRYTRQIKHGGTREELEGTWRQRMEWYLRAQDARC